MKILAVLKQNKILAIFTSPRRYFTENSRSVPLFSVRCLLFLLIEGQGWNQFLNGASAGPIFPQQIASLHFQTTQQKARLIPQAAQAHYVWVRASEVIWSEYTRIISVLSDAK